MVSASSSRPALLARLGAGGRPVILTARAAAEGGRAMDEARRRALYAAGLPHAEAIDVEIASTALAAELVPQARAAGKTVMLSAHALHATPPAAALLELVDRAEALGADLTKLVTHARNLGDLRVLLEVTLAARAPPPYSASGARRSAFFALSARFAASSFSFARRERRRFWRRMRARSAAAASATPRTRASSLSSSSRRARKRLRACERSRWHLTITPLGRWRSTTQVDTLLTFCPPFPPERTKCSSRSSSRTPSARMRASRACCFSGETGNTRAGLPSVPSAGHRAVDEVGNRAPIASVSAFERRRARLTRPGGGRDRLALEGRTSATLAQLGLPDQAATVSLTNGGPPLLSVTVPAAALVPNGSGTKLGFRGTIGGATIRLRLGGRRRARTCRSPRTT